MRELVPDSLQGEVLISGKAKGTVAGSSEMLSFWGGYDPATGIVIDRHHSLAGENLTSKIVVMKRGKGSSTGSPVLLDAIMSGNAPAGLLLNKADEIIVLGVIVCEEFFDKSIPIILLNDDDFAQALEAKEATLFSDGKVVLHH